MVMALREDLGFVWMEGETFLHNGTSDLMMMDNSIDSPLFTDGNSNICEEDLATRSNAGMDGFILLDELDDAARWCQAANSVHENMLFNVDATNLLNGESENMEEIDIQASSSVSRKIKPVKHPGLKLQTPIAYQRDTDLNVIPIKEDGRAVCEKCGAIGVKHAFYTRERRYCSLACTRASNDEEYNSNESYGVSPCSISSQIVQPESAVITIPLSKLYENNVEMTTYIATTQANLPSSYEIPVNDVTPTVSASDIRRDNRNRSSDFTCSYDWMDLLKDPKFQTAPVSCFKHAPMGGENWNGIKIGVKLEVENNNRDEGPSCWIAHIIRLAGYKALLRYEGLVNDDSKDFWVNLCTHNVHHVGYCATRGIPLIPPNYVRTRFIDWKSFLVKRLTGAHTLPTNFSLKLAETSKSKFRCDLTLEVVDKEKIFQVSMAVIVNIIGKRLQLQYYDKKGPYTFWCHENSALIHPVGWAKRVGQTLNAPISYHDRTMKGLREKDDATADVFPIIPAVTQLALKAIKIGMKLETVDPTNLGNICVATVAQILHDGYLMISLDCYEDPELFSFSSHITSPYIFPAGFCSANEINLIPPRGYQTPFIWKQYLRETCSITVPPFVFLSDIPDHGFTVGMKLEAADLMNPHLICVATIIRIAGRLLRIHFDGWGKEYDQWIDCQSPDIYPVGWCELVSHKLEPPYSSVSSVTENHPTNGRKRRTKMGSLQNDIKPLSEKSNLEINDKFLNETDEIKPLGNGITNNYDEKKENFEVADTNLVVLENGSYQECSDHEHSTDCDSDSEIKLETKELEKTIPRVLDNFISTRNCAASTISSVTIDPDTWDIADVTEFLKINDCSAYCDSFIKEEIDGKRLLELQREDLHMLTDGKVGPSLKIEVIIQKLRAKITTPRSTKKLAI